MSVAKVSHRRQREIGLQLQFALSLTDHLLFGHNIGQETHSSVETTCLEKRIGIV